jgi:DNA-binding transcriptional MerR regulator|tara:strand:+ start:1571 stop:2587 length:1017 start_codon:yes stop_codon:yes gene_type:complete
MTLSGNTNDYYRIGSVASLTGIAVERLRAWERRYQFSPAYKDGKTRFYSKDQLEILKKIKHLIDQGQTISSVINLTEDQLDARSGSAQSAPQEQNLVGQSPRIGLIGANLLQLEQRVSDNQRLDIVSRWANLDAFLRELGEQISSTSDMDAPQVLVLQLPVLTEQAIKQAQQALPNTKIVTLYQFATAHQISRCQEQQVSTLKWPLSWAEIEYTCINEFGLPRLYGVSAPRRFSDEELIAIAAEDQDPNQCAQHLVEQIHQLNALTDYLQNCAGEEEVKENGDKREALQALAQTRTETAQARAQLETALDTLITAAYKQQANAPSRAQSMRPEGFSTH